MELQSSPLFFDWMLYFGVPRSQGECLPGGTLSRFAQLVFE